MSNQIKVLSDYGVLHASDGSIIQRGITITEESRPDGVFIVVEGKAFHIKEVLRLNYPSRMVLPDGSYAMP